MANMKLSLFTVEMADGTVHEDVRIQLQDRLRTETTARTNKWNMADTNYQTIVNTFGAYAALTRRGLITCTFEQFKDGEVIDIDFHSAEGVLGDPTQAEATTA